MNFDPCIMIVDGASALAQPLARAVRSLGFFSLVVPANLFLVKRNEISPKISILAQGSLAISEEIRALLDLEVDEAENFINFKISEEQKQAKLKLLWPAPKDIKVETLNKLALFFSQKKLTANFRPEKIIETIVAEIKRLVGDSGKVILGLSGGVDSSVAAVLIHKAIGDRLLAFYIDNGLMRANESAEVEELFKNKLNINFKTAYLEDLFLDALKGVIDPEEKRKIIGKVFVDAFEKESQKQKNISFLGQGTIYPDIIESLTSAFGGPPVKSHHNVGGLPEHLNFTLVEPLKYLFKDEVRVLGEKLGLDKSLLMRQPFPGPGLGVRCLGEITKKRLDKLRKADLIVRRKIAAFSFDNKPWQYFAVLLAVKSVGMQAGKRVYGEVIAIRSINTTDAMTAQVSDFPISFLSEIAAEIVKEIPKISRVVYDITAKPPGTIEWE